MFLISQYISFTDGVQDDYTEGIFNEHLKMVQQFCAALARGMYIHSS